MDQYTIKILQTQRPPSIYNNQESVTRSRNPASAHDFGALTTPPFSTLLLQAPIQKESSLLKEVSKIKLPKYLKNKRSMNTKSS